MKLPGHTTQSLEPETATKRFLQAITDPGGKLLSTNQAFSAFFSGLPGPAQDLSSLINDSSIVNYEEAVEHCLRTGTVSQLRLEHVVGDRFLWVSWQLEAITGNDPASPVLQWIGQLEDPFKTNGSTVCDPTTRVAADQLRQSELFVHSSRTRSMEFCLSTRRER